MMTTRREIRDVRTWPHQLVLDDQFAVDDAQKPALLNDVAVALVFAAMLGTLVVWLM